MRMIRTSGPTRIDEAVVDVLLHVVDDSLLEISDIVGEQADAGCSLLHNRLVAGADCPGKVLPYQPHYACIVCIRNAAGLFPIPAPFVTARTAPHAAPKYQVTPTEEPPAEKAQSARWVIEHAVAAC